MSIFDIELFQNLIVNIKTISNKEFLKYIDEVITFNKSKLAEYAFLSSQRHKVLSIAVKKANIDISEIEKERKTLTGYLDSELNNICTENFKYILRYFNNRTSIQPRFCIKGHYEDKVKVLFRDRIRIPDRDYPIKSNTAFAYVFKTARHYICNDIPAAVKNGEYYNPRLNNQRALHYIQNNKLPKKGKIPKKCRATPDSDWVQCWELPAQKDTKFHENCYKSTLVIPMTLMNDTLSLEFKEQFQIGKDARQSIYGFLCFDSHVPYYFDQELDVLLGDIFANLLTLYFIKRLTHTRFSISYNKANKLQIK